MDANPTQRLIAQNIALAVTYAALGGLVALVAEPSVLARYASPIWPSAGLALATLLRRRATLWPGIWAGAFAYEASALWSGYPGVAALLGGAALAAGAAVQAQVGAVVVRRFFGSVPAMDAPAVVIRLLGLVAILVSLIAATFSSLVFHVLGGLSPEAEKIQWLTRWTGDTIGVMLVTPAALALGLREQSIWLARRYSLALALIVAAVVMGAGFGFINRLDTESREAEFHRHTTLLTNALTSALSRGEEAARAVVDFLHASPTFTRATFDRFAAGVHERQGAIQALEWIPVVARAGLPAHERATQEEGLVDYQVFERSAQGRRQPVSARETYYPVHFVYPMMGNRAALGFDLGSEAMRRTALRDAERQKDVAVSGRVRLVQETGDQWGVLVLAPCFQTDPATHEERLLGFALTVMRIGQLAEDALRSLPTDRLSVQLTDVAAAAEAQTLYQNAAPHAHALMRHTEPIRFGDRQWALNIVAGSDYAFAQRAWYAWATQAAGVSVSGMLVMLLLVTHGRHARTEDLVARRTAELEAARSEAVKSSQLLREAVASIAQGFTIYDEQDRLVICNDAYRQIYAESADLIVPGNTFEYIVRTGAERGQYAEAIGHLDEWVRARVAQHQNADGKPIQQQLKDGRHLLIVEYRTPSGYIVGNRVDVTELYQAQRAAEASNRSKSEFLANMSHEIRTPMNGILGMTEAVLATPLTDEQREYLGVVKRSADNLLTIINDILDFSKIEAGKLAIEAIPFELREVVQSALATQQPRARDKSLQLQLDVAPEMARFVVGDPVRIGQVLSNLVANAVKFTERGRVEVAVRLVDGELPGEQRVQFAVTDTGIGIAPDELVRIFDAFEQADTSVTRRFGGTGLGLAISRRLVVALGGELGVRSTVGVGSTFSFDLPYRPAPDPAPHAGGPAPGDAAAQLAPLNVLLVDDDDMNQRLAAVILKKAGHQVSIASNGAEALQQLAAGPFDVVLMDVQMPVMGGIEATRRIRAGEAGEARDVPVIALTASALAGDRERFLAAGMNDYVSKPISRQALFSALARATGRGAAR